MDIETFICSLEAELSTLPYIDSVYIHTLSFPLAHKRTMKLRHDFRLEVYFNSYKFNLSFALLEKNQRVWALDRDYKDGWHIHPLGNVEKHQPIEEKTVKEIIKIFDSTYRKLLIQRLGNVLFSWIF